MTIALAIAVLALSVLGWRYLRKFGRNRSESVAVDTNQACAMAEARQGDRYDLLLVHPSFDGAHQLAHWLLPELRIRVATDAEQAVQKLIDQRPDIVWMVLDGEATAGMALTRQLRNMQADAYELPSWIVALGGDAQSLRAASDAEIFDQMFPQPQSSDACLDTFRATITSMPKTSGRPWIEQSTELAMPGFLASRQQLAQAIDQAMREGRFADAAKSAHTLAGSPGMHDFEYGVAACRFIELQHASSTADALLARAKEIRDLLAHIELR